jgi:hypothetical protein
MRKAEMVLGKNNLGLSLKPTEEKPINGLASSVFSSQDKV